jgi:hypothetical protein
MMIGSGHCEYVLLQTTFTPSRSVRVSRPRTNVETCYFAHLTFIWLECHSIPVLANRVRELRHRVPIASPRIVCVKPAHPPVGRVPLTILPFVFIVVCRSLLHRGESDYLASSSRRIDAVFVPDVCEHPVASVPLVFVLDITQYLQTVHGFGHACVCAVLVVLVCDDARRDEREENAWRKVGHPFFGHHRERRKGRLEHQQSSLKKPQKHFLFFSDCSTCCHIKPQGRQRLFRTNSNSLVFSQLSRRSQFDARRDVGTSRRIRRDLGVAGGTARNVSRRGCRALRLESALVVCAARNP